VLQRVDGDVGRQVVHAVQGLVERQGEALGRGDADQQRAGQAGSAGDRDRVDVGRLDPRGLAGPPDRRDHRLQVRATGDLRYDAAEPGVLLDTGRDRVGEQRLPADDPDPGLVTRRLDPQNQGLVHTHSSSRHRMITASSPPA
jgi:hypothetical protein